IYYVFIFFLFLSPFSFHDLEFTFILSPIIDLYFIFEVSYYSAYKCLQIVLTINNDPHKIFYINNNFNYILFNISTPLILLCILYYYFQIYSTYLSIIPLTIFQRFLEFSVKFNLNLIKQQIGVIGYSYLNFIYCIFFFILFSNLFGVLPFGI